MTAVLETKVETRRLILPRQANTSGTAHGGTLLKWMEQVAAMSAMRCAGTDVVTVGMDGARFHHPIPQGRIALIDAYTYEVGTSSLQVRVRGYDEDPTTGDTDLATEAFVVMAALDEDGATTEVAPLGVESDRGRRLRREAVAGREGEG